jgi:hypothetical protein
MRDYVQNVQGFGRGMDELLSRGPDTGD